MKKLTISIILACSILPMYANTQSDSIAVQKSAGSIADSKPDSAKQQGVAELNVPAPAANTNESTAKFDKIIKKTGETINGTVVRKNLYEVQYTLPGEKTIKRLSTTHVKEIQYADGKTDVIESSKDKNQKDKVSPSKEKEWEKILVTYEESAISGMVSKGMVETYYEAKKLDTENDVLERSAIVVLKRKAFTLGASAILIRLKEFKREYGELPAVTMKAEAFGN